MNEKVETFTLNMFFNLKARLCLYGHSTFYDTNLTFVVYCGINIRLLFTGQFYWVVDYATNYLTSLHIVSFSALRYVAIKKPFQESSLSQKTIAFYILALWALAFLSACPLAFLMGVDLERGKCVNCVFVLKSPLSVVKNKQYCHFLKTSYMI